MMGSTFVFYCVHVLFLKNHEINSNPRGSYKDSLDWIKNKKASQLNSIDKNDNKCFQYTVKLH